MASCKFSNELNRLCKSSSDSIDHIDEFDSFKGYMHVIRTAEEDLKELLRRINDSGNKTLVLLCGSAGDGKSHLLSYLKNSDEENLIAQYVVYNDATESSAPSKTAIDTLHEILAPFKDDSLETTGKNMIIAINLGVLSNFIESKYGKDFSILRKYVEERNIFTTQVNEREFDANSHIQHVSFSDYHMYSLTENGVHAGYIEDILAKIFAPKEENLFYQSYLQSCLSCPLSQKCPVKKNYEYMMKTERQKFIAELLVKTTIQDKFILTTREILNFVYNILVSRDFNYKKFQKILVNDAAYLKEFLKQITPALLFDSTDVTVLMNIMKKYDPLLSRSEKADEHVISYYVSSDVSSQIKEAFAENTFGGVICDSDMIVHINNDKTLRSDIYNLIVRVYSIEQGNTQEKVYNKFLENIFWYNSGNSRKLGSLYGMVENAVIQWCGSDGDGNVCLDNKYKGFYLYEKVEFTPSIRHIPHKVEQVELQRFTPIATVAFEQADGNLINLDIDYTLYELIDKLNQGYIQTADDRNNHADFIGFINRILQTGSLAEKVWVLSEHDKRAVISKDMFGYKFKAVK